MHGLIKDLGRHIAIGEVKIVCCVGMSVRMLVVVLSSIRAQFLLK